MGRVEALVRLSSSQVVGADPQEQQEFGASGERIPVERRTQWDTVD